MAYLLGIDLGTSSVKAGVFDSTNSALRAVASREYPIDKPAPDRAEQDPAAWWAATVAAVREALDRAGRVDVAAISFSGQMHGVVLLDGSGESLGPAIIWADQRSAGLVPDLVETVGAARYQAITGTLPAAGFMAVTLAWLARHDPDRLDRARRVILPKDEIRRRLTGEIATDPSDAASTALFDITARAWASEIITRAGLPDRLFPPVLESAEIAGTLRPDAADALGLRAGIPVITGCADQPAQATGNGLIAPGKGSVTIGSGGQVFLPVRRGAGGQIATDARLHVFNHAVPETWYILGATLSAGLSLRWLRGITGLEGRPDAYATLSAEAAHVAPGADGLLFLPYLSGERTPHMDPLARGAFIGLNAHHTRGHLARAVMEGVTFTLRQALEISLELGGQVNTLIAAGGASESAVWRQIQADVFGVPLQKSLQSEQAAIGAAMLAGIGVGVYRDFEDACARVVRADAPTAPDPARHARYDGLYAHFCELYPRLRHDFHRLSGGE